MHNSSMSIHNRDSLQEHASELLQAESHGWCSGGLFSRVYFRARDQHLSKGVLHVTRLQEQAIEMIYGLSDDDVRFLIEVMQRLMPQVKGREAEREQAFQSLNAARSEIKKYFPADFDSVCALKEAKYGRYQD